MSKTILIGHEQKYSELYSLNLQMYIGTEMLIVKNNQQAIELLNLIGSVDLIVCEGPTSAATPNESLKSISDFLLVKKYSIPLFLIGGHKPTENNVVFLENPLDISTLIKMAAKTLNVTAKEMAYKDVGDYFPVNPHFLVNLKESLCDVFLRSKNGDNTFNFFKIIGAHEKVTSELIQKYCINANEKFYIPSHFRLKFTDRCTEQVSQILSNHNLAQQERVNITENTTQVVYEEFKNNGLTDNVVQLSQTCIKSISKIVSNHSKLNGLLKILLINKSSYAFTHCQITNYVAFHLIKNMDWGSQEQQDKISFVTFFHDIFLTDDRLCKIRSEEELKSANLTAAEVEMVNQHALQASSLIQDYPLAPIGADVIIRQHHGARSGVGFNKELAYGVSPLSLVFIIAEDFTSRMLEQHATEGTVSVMNIVEKMSSCYRKIKQRKLIEILCGLKF